MTCLYISICLFYGIINTSSCIIYHYRACITIIDISTSFILPLTRSLSDDPGFACPGWISELSYCPIVYCAHRRLLIETLHRYLYDLLLLSYLSLFSYLLCSLTSFCRYSCTYFMLEPMSIWRLLLY